MPGERKTDQGRKNGQKEEIRPRNGENLKRRQNEAKTARTQADN